MKVFKISLLIVITILGMSLISCDKNDEDINPTAINEVKDMSFKYKEDIKVEDESKQYYIVVSFQSNSKQALKEAIEAKPYITVGDDINLSFSNSNTLNTSSNKESVDEHKTNQVLYLFTKNRNIPKGILYLFHPESNKGNIATKSSRGSMEYKTFQDDNAKKVYTANTADYYINFEYYSRSDSWYDWTWKWRGWRKLKIDDEMEHTFDASVYTEELGVKIKARSRNGFSKMVWYAVD